MRKIKYIVLHCTATPQSATVESIKRYWRENLGWKNPGYHHIISADGTITDLLPIQELANGVAGYNSNSIHISYIGGVDEKGRPFDNRTAKQFLSQLQLVHKYIDLFPEAVIAGHKDFPMVQKACPSFEVTVWLKSVKLPEQSFINHEKKQLQ